MMARVFLDTVYVEALLNPRDQYHPQALELAQRLRAYAEVWTTEAILIEVGNALSAIDRMSAVRFIQRSYRTANVHVNPVDTTLLGQAVRLYEARGDKEWGLTDCISFIVMQKRQITDVATADHHFRQAGFRALLLEDG